MRSSPFLPISILAITLVVGLATAARAADPAPATRPADLPPATTSHSSEDTLRVLPFWLEPENPHIDMRAYLAVSQEAAALREKHRVTEAAFIRMSHEPGTVILDARSRQKYELLHIKGAINLSFPDIAIESLAQTIPDKNTRILIYCNNNFLNEPRAFPSKVLSAALNIHTFNVLFAYGYTNVYELGPLVDIHSTQIPFEGALSPRDTLHAL